MGEIWTILARSYTGAAAMVQELLKSPIWAMMAGSATNFSAIRTASLASPRLSAISRTTFLPWMPPSLFTRSKTMVTERLKSAPYSAQSPVSGAERPILDFSGSQGRVRQGEETA